MLEVLKNQVEKYDRRISKLEKLPPAAGLKSSILGYQIMRDYYKELISASESDVPVVWYDGVVPHDLFHVMGALPLDMEFFAYHMVLDSPKYIEIAEGKGFSSDLCSSIRVEVGLVMSEPLPKPDFIVCASTNCDSCYNCCQYYSHALDAPIFPLDSPYDSSEESVDYYVEEHKRLISFMEKVTGREFDYDKLRETTNKRRKVYQVLADIQELRKAVPSPIRGRDALRIPGIAARAGADDRAMAWVEMMRDEVQGRVDRGEGAIKNEKHRILWLQTAPLFQDVSKILEDEFNASIVMSELDDVGRRGRIEGDDPIRSLARSALQFSWNGLAEHRVKRVLQLAEEFKADACIHFSQWGCKVVSNSAAIIKNTLENELGIPTLIIKGDYMDARNFSEADYRSQFEILMEML